jgi:membrane protein
MLSYLCLGDRWRENSRALRPSRCITILFGPRKLNKRFAISSVKLLTPSITVVTMKRRLGIIKRTFVSAISGFSDGELMTRAAALAFYSALSFAPLLILLVWVLSALHSSWQHDLAHSLTSVIGKDAADAVTDVIDNAKSRPHVGNVAGIVGIVVMLFTASAVFAQLQATLNRVWRVRAKPGAAVSAWLRARAHAFALLVGLAFMLIVSFVLSGFIHLVVPRHTLAWQVSENVVSLLILILAFGAMYKVLPDAKIDWLDAFNGAVLTAVLFLAGKFAIGFYIDHSSAEGAYGPAGAFVVVLTWVYYSSIIVLVGAELTRAIADARGKPIQPDDHAVVMDDASLGIPLKHEDTKRSDDLNR